MAMRVEVRHGSANRELTVPCAGLHALRRATADAFNLPYLPVLVFEAPQGDLACVDTDLALKILLAARHPSLPNLIALHPHSAPPRLSVHRCFNTVFNAMVDTAAKVESARGEVAAVILAMSGAWDQIASPASASTQRTSTTCQQRQEQEVHSSHNPYQNVQERPHSRSSSPLPRTSVGASTASATTSTPSPRARPSSPSPSSRPSTPPSPMSVSPRSSAPSSPRSTSASSSPRRPSSPQSPSLSSRVRERDVSGMQARSLSPLSAESAAASERAAAISCFCTHAGISCAHCHASSITGPLYRCTSCAEVNLCERCRRSGVRCADRHAYTVYDHPWEASAEYANLVSPEAFRAPPAPLTMGDRGPRVAHLHFVLYTLGYLILLVPGFRVDVFGKATRDAVHRFQIDQDILALREARGAYGAGTRSALLLVFDEIEARLAAPCRREVPHPPPARPRLRSALAA